MGGGGFNNECQQQEHQWADVETGLFTSTD